MRSVTTQLAEGVVTGVERTIALDVAENFSRLYAQTHLSIFRYIYGIHGGPQEDVEDLTAETYIRAWRARRRFVGDEDAALRWLLQIARHLVIDSHRKRARRGIPDNIEDFSIASKNGSPEDQTLANEQVALLARMLEALSERQREILVLRYILGWRVNNIADYLRMAPNTVSVTIRRSLDRLRKDWPRPQPAVKPFDKELYALWAAGKLAETNDEIQR